MYIHCLGLNHRTADVTIRERLTFTPYRLETALARIACRDEAAWNAIQEMVILSTCNRVEIYAIASDFAFDTLEQFLTETQGVPDGDYAHALYYLDGEEAIMHLLRVAAGLDSLILGESQILGQVSEAYSTARSNGTAGKILSPLFQLAIRAGKIVRTETAISQNPGSVASVAVKLMAEIIPEFSNARVTVLGAGEMAELAVEALRKRGSTQIVVVNRTLENACHLAKKWGAETATLGALPDVIAQADILITSTGAPHAIIHRSLVQKTMRFRTGRPLVIMDIAVPRDVEAGVEEIPGVRLFDIDMLAEGLETSLAKRRAEIPHIEAILAEEHANFMNFLTALDVIPVIAQMRRQADTIRQVELERTIRRTPDLTPEMQTSIDALTRSIVKKILHQPTIRLRAEAGGPKASDYAEFARGLFGLD